ncbi:MAG: PIG-L family deacetylase [Bryobacterales bacterium]|nr:PIG-L family deacetylase [Bryobacterales bacterium]
MADDGRRILVVSASSADYIYGAGATLAQYVEDGWRVDVALFANEEKMSQGLSPAQTRLVNMQEARAAAKQLGAADVILMDLKSGELGQVSATEMRAQLFALIRGVKPRILFIPDPYVHYQDDQDVVFTGNMAEEAWGYSGGGTFANELARMGLTPYGAPEVFYYSAYRPYRKNEGGETERAKFVHRNIAGKLEHKIHAAELLHQRNRAWLALRGRPADDASARQHARLFIEEMAAAIGAKYGLAQAEEFNHVAAAGSPAVAPAFTKRQETTQGNVLVITPSMRDALFAAGGTLARMAAEGRAVFVAVFGNEEKMSAGLGPAETRIANNQEGERAAKLLGVREVIQLGHKSGELGMLSSSELRNQVMALTRLYKPEILFFPDWYVHYQDDNDLYRTGRMAEESPYGGSSLFLQEMSYLGFPGAAARQYYFFVPFRPYRKGEGGEGPAVMKQSEIGDLLEKKVQAALELKTANEAWAAELSARSGRKLAAEALVRAFLTEMAETVGAAHGMKFAEEFNHLRPVTGIPAHVREKARRSN